MKKTVKNNLLDTEMTASDNAFAQNKMLKVILGVIGVIGVAIYFQVAELKDSYRTVIQFPMDVEGAEISGRDASDRYLMMAAEFITSVYFSATPATVDSEFSVLMRFAHPTRYGVLQERFEKEASRLKELKTASTYGDIDWSRGFKKVAYVGDKYRGVSHVNTLRFDVSRSVFVGALSEPAEIENRTMAVDYVVENGKFYLLDLTLEDRKDAL